MYLKLAGFLFSIGFISCTLFGQTRQDTLSVYFDFNKSELNAEQLAILQKINSSDKRVVLLIAHCDTVGSEAYNYRLAKKRADFVQNTASGITDPEVKVVGEREAGRTTEYEDRIFRRVDIVYQFDFKEVKCPVPQIAEEMEVEENRLTNQLVDFLKNDTLKEVKIELTILFYSNSDIYYPQYEAELWELFDFLHYNQHIKAHIRGHVCCTNDYQLSADRAYKVYKFLFERSISRDRLTYKGYSNTEPLVPELTDEDRRKNRRVEVVFTKVE